MLGYVEISRDHDHHRNKNEEHKSQMLARLRDWLRKATHKPEYRTWAVDHERGGYRIGDLFIPRSDINLIVAFKRDLLTIDQVCVGIGFGEGALNERPPAEFIEEDNPSFAAVLADLEKHFELEEGWRAKVELPPFEENRTLL